MRIELPATLNAFVQSCKKTISKWYGRAICVIYKLPRITQLSLKAFAALESTPKFYRKIYAEDLTRLFERISSGEISYTDEKARKLLIQILPTLDPNQKSYTECIRAVEVMYKCAAENCFGANKQREITPEEMNDFANLFKILVALSSKRDLSKDFIINEASFKEKLYNALKLHVLADCKFNQPQRLLPALVPYSSSSVLELLIAPSFSQYIDANIDDVTKTEILDVFEKKPGDTLGGDELAPTNILGILTMFQGDIKSFDDNSSQFNFYYSLLNHISSKSDPNDPSTENALLALTKCSHLAATAIILNEQQGI